MSLEEIDEEVNDPSEDDMSDYFDDPLIEILKRLTEIESKLDRLIPIAEAFESMVGSPMAAAFGLK